MNYRPHTQGFTLIELLVVISIIGLLSAVILGSLGTARTKGRDATRIVDVRELKKAIEFYYNDQAVPSYPKIGSESSVNVISGLATPLVGGATKYIGAIAQTLIDGDGSSPDLYYWRSTGTLAADPADSYVIVVYTESGGLCKTGAGPAFCVGPTCLVSSLNTLCSF